MGLICIFLEIFFLNTSSRIFSDRTTDRSSDSMTMCRREKFTQVNFRDTTNENERSST